MMLNYLTNQKKTSFQRDLNRGTSEMNHFELPTARATITPKSFAKFILRLLRNIPNILGCVGGLVVSILASHSDNKSSNPV